ncbi:MAG: hypothetical protein UHI85_08065 [Turicibacter sp.]|nr:hypothetical protein [Turicibacter sp.]
MLKELLKKQIQHKLEKGLSVESDIEKMNFFFLRGQLTAQEYDELLALVEPKEEVIVEELVEEELVEE